MKHCFLLLCLLFSISLFAQNTANWFPPGAKWQFQYESLNGPGLEYLERVGTETIGGHACAKLHYYGYHQGSPAGPVDHGYEYFYAQNDSVFRWNDSEFKLWYDFTRTAGDTLHCPNGLYDYGLVDSTGTETIWNQPVRFQDVTLYNTNYPPLPTRLYENIGGNHLIFWDIESPLTEIQYALTCYGNNLYPMACSFTILPTTNPYDPDVQMRVYPNPTSGTITLQWRADALPALARMFDAQGREVSRRTISEPRTTWELPTGAAGALFLNVQAANGHSESRMLHLE